MLTTEERIKLTTAGEGPMKDNASARDWNRWELENAIRHCLQEPGALPLEDIALILSEVIMDRDDIAMLSGMLQTLLDSDDRIDDHD